jgi:LPXTG-motif cell wall-anchored protein
MEPGQVLVYRLEGTGVSGFIDFGQHEMEAGSAIPSLTNWGLMILVALLVASAVFVFFRRKRVTVSP